jgi:hypothetical protein
MNFRHVNLGSANKRYILKIENLEVINYAVSYEHRMSCFIIVLGVDRLEI